MPLPATTDVRFDWRGGVNRQFTQDTRDGTELTTAQNCRFEQLGALTKRTTTKRIHANAIGSGTDPVRGVYYFNPGTPQIVAICDGKLYHKTLAAADFTEVSTVPIPDVAARFFTYRSGNDILLYICAGGLFKWNGTTLTDETPTVDGSPREFIDGVIYRNRAYATEGTKRLYVSARLDPDEWVVGGDYYDIEQYDAEPLTSLLKVGSSLLPMKRDTVSRYTGISTEDVQIDTEQEGISATLGNIALQTAIQIDEAGLMLTEAGLFIVTESGIEEISGKIDAVFVDEVNRAQWQNAVAGYLKRRREVVLFLPPTGSSNNTLGWLFNLETRTWAGPWVSTFPITCLGRYERANGDDSLLAGGSDGFVRDLDASAETVSKDDMLADGTGGTAIPLSVELPTLIEGVPMRNKLLRKRQSIEADLGTAYTTTPSPAGGLLTVSAASEHGTQSLTIPSIGAGVKDYSFRMSSIIGTRPTFTLAEATDQPTQLNGLILSLAIGRTKR